MSVPPGVAPPIRRLGVLGNVEHAGLEPVLERLSAIAESLGLVIHPGLDLAGRLNTGAGPLEEALDEIDAILTLGGDGTLLRGARMAGPRGVAVLGCNLGRLGFLTAVAQEELEIALQHAAAGECVEERRLALEVQVDRRRPGGQEAPFYSVNDAVIHMSGFARMIMLRVWADEEEIGQYSADGIILSTATGSTAYSLSAGGPILVPNLDAIVATPISPHTLAVRPVVLPGGTRVSVELLSGHEEMALTVDGQTGSTLRVGDVVRVVRSEHPLRLLRLPEDSFFSVLRRKLRWGDVRPTDR